MNTHVRSMIATIPIRILVIVFAGAVAVDVAPNNWMPNSGIQRNTRKVLAKLGLAQGEWSLFAPNPGMRCGYIVGELRDREGNTAVWKSPDWTQESVLSKFFRFRYLNYYQRVVDDTGASIDLADYLQRSIPRYEKVQPGLRLTEDLEIASSEPLTLPISQVTLYHHQLFINLSYEEPIPKPSDLVTTEMDRFLVKRSYPP